MRKAPLFVVPVDFSPEMEATVSAAFALAKKRGAHVDLLEVVSRRVETVSNTVRRSLSWAQSFTLQRRHRAMLSRGGQAKG